MIYFGKSVRGDGGQVLLIVILTMVVALTVGLSIASRTITNLKLSKQTEESNRAFQAAEAGIERALRSGSTNTATSSLNNNSSFSITVTEAKGTSLLLNGGELVDQDAGFDVWLSNYPSYSDQIGTPGSPATVTFYWNSTSQTTCIKDTAPSDKIRAALEVLVLSGTVATPTLTKYIFDGAACNRIPGDSDSGNGGLVQNQTFVSSASITVANGIIMKVIPLFNSTKIGVTSNIALPNQGSVIDSTGIAGDTSRRVVYFKSYPQIPLELFPYTLVAGDITN